MVQDTRYPMNRKAGRAVLSPPGRSAVRTPGPTRWRGSWPQCAPNGEGASHEPQKVAQASCLFGADRLEACPTLQPAARFMAPTHVQFLEVFPFHEPQKVVQASCLFGADRLEACPTLQPAARFMAPTRVRILEVFALHEPQKVAQASCLFGADRLEACPTGSWPQLRSNSLEVFALHEPTRKMG